jgi:hypothetical protein
VNAAAILLDVYTAQDRSGHANDAVFILARHKSSFVPVANQEYLVASASNFAGSLALIAT